MTFQVKADTKGGAAAKAWADELRTAVARAQGRVPTGKARREGRGARAVDSVAPAANGST